MLRASSEKITLNFKRPAGTSRGVLKTKNSWIIRIWKDDATSIVGTGEASIIETLSPEWGDAFIDKIESIDEWINSVSANELIEFPSIRFAVESALLDLKNGGKEIYYPSDFTEAKESIYINGLIWMGDKDFMLDQIKTKMDLGFRCIKMKIGAIDFEDEIELLQFIRDQFTADQLELRVDANGAFSPENALDKLERLSSFDLHSIEQPIKQGQWSEMANLCNTTPLPIALDEELIGVNELEQKRELLSIIQPQYIILKPSLVGGFNSSDEWIGLAEELGIGWWITSALESNIGLNAIAQYTATKKSPMPQGLGTGQLFTNNIQSTLKIVGDRLFHH